MSSSAAVLVFPVLPGVAFPRLEAEGLLCQAPSPARVGDVPEAVRAAVRVLITTAQLGCDAALLDALPHLAHVVSLGAGTDRIDRTALAARGIGHRPIGEALTQDVADLAMTLTVMAARDLRQADRFARDGGWRTARFAVGRSLTGATMGIAGLGGRIGQAIARRAVAAEMTVIGLARPSAAALGFALSGDMASLARESDVLMLCLPGSPDLRHVVGAEVLDALGPDGILVNVGRGELVDTAALVAALRTGRIAAAALDVLEGEPMVPADLATLENLVLTPHIGGATWGARARAAAIAEAEALRVLAVHAA
jgi:lactate dehydrogenase-like 2-hydroxyacid dehydrogenase